jgi:DNA-binding Lrp family transcriptional regulator
MKAYTLVNILPNFEPKICAKLKNMIELQKTPGRPIQEFHILFGEYDIIIEINVETLEELYETIWQIARLEGVTKTSTHLEVPMESVLKKTAAL